MKVTKRDLYEWFFDKSFTFSSEHKLLEMFLIQQFDEETGTIRMTKAAIRHQTGLSKYHATKYVKALEATGEWEIVRVHPEHSYTFTPIIAQKN